MADTNISTHGADCVSAISDGTLPLAKVNLPNATIPVAKLVQAQHVLHVAFNSSNLSYVLPRNCIGAWMRPGAQGGAGGGAGGPSASNNAGGGGGAGRAGGSCCLTYVPLAIPSGTTVAVTVGTGGTGGSGGISGGAGAGTGGLGTSSKIEVGGNTIVEAPAMPTPPNGGNFASAATAAGAGSAVTNNWPFGLRAIANVPSAGGNGGSGVQNGFVGSIATAATPVFYGATLYVADVAASLAGTLAGTKGGGGGGGSGASATPGDEIVTALGLPIPPTSGAGSGQGGVGGTGANAVSSGTGPTGGTGSAGSSGSLGRGGGGGGGGGGCGGGSVVGLGGTGGAGGDGSTGAVILVLAVE